MHENVLTGGMPAISSTHGFIPNSYTEAEKSELIKQVPHDKAKVLTDKIEIMAESADIYAADFDIPHEEALKRLAIQEQLGNIEQLITEGNPNSFASLYIEHNPEYRIVVMSTLKDPTVMQAYFDTLEYDVPLSFKTVDNALIDLEKLQADTAAQLYNASIDADMNINIHQNRVEVYVTDINLFKQQTTQSNITLPITIHIEQTESLLTPAVSMHGGYLFRSYRGKKCTFGFPVYSSWRHKSGLSTAGHCDNTGKYATHAISSQYERNWGPYDIQFMQPNSSSTYISNLTFTGYSHQRMFTSKLRNSQSIGSWVYKYGRTSGRTSGKIRSRWYTHKGYSTYILTDMVTLEGDSGGPVFLGSTAYGSVVGMAPAKNGQHGGMIYMAMDYFFHSGLTLRQSYARN